MDITNKIQLTYTPEPVQGFITAGIHSGIKSDPTALDLGLIYCENTVAAAGVFTTNVAKAAPVTLNQEHLKCSTPKAILINSGNANACTGEQGINDAIKSSMWVATALGLKKEDVLISSTGIIGVPLPMDALEKGIPELASSLSSDQIGQTAEAIMTTDTFSKAVTVTFEIDGKPGQITGIAKGSGMIHPNMATMLGFIMTDVSISSEQLNQSLKNITDVSFNMISVDGDTSTNDMVLALASGASDAPIVNTENSSAVFKKALTLACTELAKLIAKDGEGATKLLEMEVVGATSIQDASLAAKAVIASSLVKSAFFGNDANWGRILCAMGYSGAEFDPQKVDLSISSKQSSIQLMKSGTPVVFDEDNALQVLSTDSIHILADMNQGSSKATAWGCDLTYDYVKINGEYRS